jgi:hypothetical protein
MLAFLFATPWSALATIAAAASVPIIIHLLNRRRFRIVDWAAMRFLLAAQRQNVRRLRLEQWLLLAIRCGILVLLAIALAAVTPWAESLWQRFMPGSGLAAPAVSGRTHKVIIVDSSLSMTARGEDGTAFDRARTLAAELVRTSAGGDGFSVVAMGTPLQAIVPGPAEDAGKVVREIEALRCSHGPADLAAALNLSDELIRRTPGKYAQREIHVLTDLHRATWSPPSSPSGSWTEPWARLQAQAQLVVVDVGRDAVENLAVTDLTIGDSLAVVGVRTSVTATVHNFTRRERAAERVELLFGRDTTAPVVVQQETVTIPAGGSAAVTFPMQFTSAGDYLIQARIATDALEADNTRSLIVSVRDALPVLLVNGKPGVEWREQAASWLSRALNPFADDARRPMYPARPTTIDLAQFSDPVAGDFSAYDAVFLCDVPRVTEREAARLESHLQRGGGLVIALGPNVDLENYNRLLGGSLPGRLSSMVRAPTDKFFTLAAVNDAFQRPPLAAFAADNDRASLLGARFRQYVRVEPPAATGARKLLTFVPPPGLDAESSRRILADPLVLERPLHRGLVVLIASSINTDWTSWPIAPSFPPFVQELLRQVVRPGPRRTVTVGEPLEEWLPANIDAMQATVHAPDDRSEIVSLTAEQYATPFQFLNTDQSGLYRLKMGGSAHEQIFAVNVPSRIESDLQRLSAGELQSLTPEEDVQIVSRLDAVHRRPKQSATAAADFADLGSTARGPGLARILLATMFGLLLVEGCLAWRFGSARSGARPMAEPKPTASRRILDVAMIAIVGLLMVGCFLIGLILIHAAWKNDFLGFLPAEWRGRIETALGVPPAAAGEGTRWRLEFLPFLTGRAANDRWLVGIIGVAAVALAIWLYRRDVPPGPRRPYRIVPLVALRIALFGLALGVLLPQVRLLFEREGWPDFVILIDDSRSMNHADDYQDADARAKLAALAQSVGIGSPRRLALVQALIGRNNAQWLDELIAGRQVKLHIFHCAESAERLVSIDSADDRTARIEAVRGLRATGAHSRLGTAVESILQEFRGSALAGIVFFTDGVTTDGDDLVAAAQLAAHAGVPLYPIGVGDAHEPRDIILHDLQVNDSVHVQDRLVFEARVSARGGIRATSVPVSLLEQSGDQWKTIKHDTVTLDPTGRPVRVRLTHAPTQPGERRFAIEIPVQPDETDSSNNRLERTIVVAEAQRTRVLYIEGYPRYEYRFLKTLLERESDRLPGNKSIELAALLADSDPDYAKQDRSAIDALPASRDELFRQFDLVILGDIDPRHPKLGEKHLQWLADFVKEKGGGLLAIAGSQFMPAAYRDTPLADVLPIEPSERPEADDADHMMPFRLRLTPVGQMHPLFHLAPDETDNQAVWERLMPQYWSAGRLRPKAAAEVLAARPSGSGSSAEPIAVQQFVGAGRVLFFGFDETWRWRRREDERQYNQFWIQTVRFLARTRLGRPDLRLDRQTPYRQGEPIRVFVRFPEDVPPPGPDMPVEVAIESTGSGGDIEGQKLRLTRQEGSRATYEAIVTRTIAGAYRFLLSSPTSNGPPPDAVAKVLPPPGELDNLQLNRTDLERAALASHGRFYALADADRLPAELPELPRVALHQPRPPYELWSHPGMFMLGLALIGVEWLLRKRHHLL